MVNFWLVPSSSVFFNSKILDLVPVLKRPSSRFLFFGKPNTSIAIPNLVFQKKSLLPG
jgi:hypothetical protein